MRRRKTDLSARVNGNLPLEFDDVTLTSYAGLELFAQYLRRIDFNRTVVPRLQSIQTLRFELFHRAALLVRPEGRPRLRLRDNPDTRQTFMRIATALARAA